MVVFLDTNVFLHYRRFSEIDWLALAKERPLTILFPPITLRELNAKKDGNSSVKIKRRAQSALSDIEALFGNEIRGVVRENVLAEFIPADPRIVFADHNLRPDIQDDWLIASVIERKASSGSERCVLVTSDLGLKLKCRGHQIEVLQLPPELKLPEEDDSEAKRIRQLEAENLTLKSAAPILNLSFAGGASVLKLEFKPAIAFDAEAAARKLVAEKSRLKFFPTIRREDLAEPGTIAAIMAKNLDLVAGYSRDDIDRYNSSLQEYFDRHLEELEEQNLYDNILQRSHYIDLGVTNNGTTPAEEITVHLHFPDGFTLRFKDEFPERPEFPNPPSEPLSWSEKMQTSFQPIHMPDYSLPHVDLSAIGRPRESSTIKRTNSFDVDFEFGKLKHGFTKELRGMVLTLEAPAKPISFQIDYEIHAANLPKPSLGKLHVVIDVP